MAAIKTDATVAMDHPLIFFYHHSQKLQQGANVPRTEGHWLFDDES